MGLGALLVRSPVPVRHIQPERACRQAQKNGQTGSHPRSIDLTAGEIIRTTGEIIRLKGRLPLTGKNRQADPGGVFRVTVHRVRRRFLFGRIEHIRIGSRDGDLYPVPFPEKMGGG